MSGVVLEVKFTSTFPRWVADLIRRFDLQRRSVPKYVLCLSAEARPERALGRSVQEIIGLPA